MDDRWLVFILTCNFGLMFVSEWIDILTTPTLNTVQFIYWITVNGFWICFTCFTLIHHQIGVSRKHPRFSLLSNTEDTVQLQAYRKHTIYPLLAPRRSVTEFISQSNTVFPPAGVSCHSFLRCFCKAQHTWDDDSPKKTRLVVSARHRSAQGESVIPLKALEIPLHDNRSQYIDVIVGSDFCHFERETFCSVPGLCCQLHFHTDIFMYCFPGTAFRDWSGGPWRHRRAPDVLYSHLPKWDCPTWPKTLLQHQTWRDGQLFCSKFLPSVFALLIQTSAAQSALQATGKLMLRQ